MVILGLGSNLESSFGDRFKNIDLAITSLNNLGVSIIKKSRLSREVWLGFFWIVIPISSSWEKIVWGITKDIKTIKNALYIIEEYKSIFTN